MARLIGTAGHVDHGKTTLLRALTGIDADRLPEEKKRGMTIDIGFAYIDLPSHGRVSIVDVPGHERFVTNMLVGALGIDVALLCVAADEGVMPQTREHLTILKLLPVDRMVVALTRSDLVDDETRELIAAEVRDAIAGTRFAQAPLVPVSAVTGEGLETLREALDRALGEADTEGKGLEQPWYLPIDRAFSVKGHGCVVTGTLPRGRVRVGDSAVLQPGNLPVRVRGIHVHGEAVEESERGRRTALNLSGVRVEDVRRGMVVGASGAVYETTIFDAHMTWENRPKHGQRVRVSIGADEAIGRVFLNERDEQLAQFRLDAPTAVALTQPLIVRRYSPPEVFGGGHVVVPQSRPRRKKEEARLARSSDPKTAIPELLGSDPNGLPTEEICRHLGMSPQQLGDVFEQLQRQKVVQGFAGLWIARAAFIEGAKRFLAALDRVHERHPTKTAVPREEVVKEAGLTWSGKPLDRIVTAIAGTGKIEAHGTNVRAKHFQVQLPPRQRQLLDRVLEQLQDQEIGVPSPLEIAMAIGVPRQAVEEILKVGLQAGEVVSLGEGLYYTPKQLQRIKERVRAFAGERAFSASEVRDALGTTRKYIIPLLEHFDSVRFTTRVGDKRVVSKR